MALEFEETATIEVNASLLDLCAPGQFIKTAKRSTKCKNLFYWLCCFPNGYGDDEKGHVSVYLLTSTGDFQCTWNIAIDRSEIKDYCTYYFEDPVDIGFRRLASHETIRSGSAIKNGVFVIRYKLVFKIKPEKLDNNELLKTAAVSKDSCIVKFDCKTLETYKPGDKIIEQKRTVDGVKWWIEYYPCGLTDEDKGNVSVFFRTTSDQREMACSCAMLVDKDLIQQYFYHGFLKSANWGFSKCFSHKQCKLASDHNGIVDLVCKVKFKKPIQTVSIDLAPRRASTNKWDRFCHR